MYIEKKKSYPKTPPHYYNFIIYDFTDNNTELSVFSQYRKILFLTRPRVSTPIHGDFDTEMNCARTHI